MSKYAKLNSDNIVENTIICNDSEILNFNGKFIKETNETNSAEIGYEYVEGKNKFKSPQPYPSWILDEEECIWTSPVEKPEGFHTWDEESQEWIALK